MARPFKYRRNIYIFRPTPSVYYHPEDRIVMEHICPVCRKPLKQKQIRRGTECCSRKCSNIKKGITQRGKKHNMLRVLCDR